MINSNYIKRAFVKSKVWWHELWIRGTIDHPSLRTLTGHELILLTRKEREDYLRNLVWRRGVAMGKSS